MESCLLGARLRAVLDEFVRGDRQHPRQHPPALAGAHAQTQAPGVSTHAIAHAGTTPSPTLAPRHRAAPAEITADATAEIPAEATALRGYSGG